MSRWAPIPEPRDTPSLNPGGSSHWETVTCDSSPLGESPARGQPWSSCCQLRRPGAPSERFLLRRPPGTEARALPMISQTQGPTQRSKTPELGVGEGSGRQEPCPEWLGPGQGLQSTRGWGTGCTDRAPDTAANQAFIRGSPSPHSLFPGGPKQPHPAAPSPVSRPISAARPVGTRDPAEISFWSR